MGVFALVLVLVGAWTLFIATPRVPENSRFTLDLEAVRRLALARHGERLPMALNVLIVAESAKPAIGAIGGLRLDRWVMAWTAFQIVYDEGFLIVDAAADATFHRERGADGAFFSERFESLQQALLLAKGILFTHEHPDHLVGVSRSPHLAEIHQHILLTREQLTNGEAMDAAGFPPEIRARLRRIEFDRHLRVAPGVVAIKAPGHTPGSQIIYVRLAGGPEILLVGDIAWHRAHLDEPRGHPRLSAWLLGEDLPAVLEQLRTLHDAIRSEGIVAIPSHDGAYLLELYASGLVGLQFTSLLAGGGASGGK